MLFAMAKQKVILEKILKRLSSTSVAQELVDNLTMGQLTTLLLHVFFEKSKKQKVHEIAKGFAENRFAKASAVSPIKLRKLETEIFELAQKRDIPAVELSPVAPLGSASVFGHINQNNVLSALRGCEVVSDPSNALALLLIHQWLGNKKEKVLRLCASHQALRAQKFDRPGCTPHFRLFSSCSLIKSKEPNEIVQEALIHLHLVKDVANMCQVETTRSTLYPRKRSGHLAKLLADELEKLALPFQVRSAEEDESSYYYGFRFTTDFQNRDGWFNVGDCGLVDWAAQIASQKDLVLVTNGLGVDRLLAAMP